MMKAAIVVSQDMKEAHIRQCIYVSRLAGAQSVKIWAICHTDDLFWNMPVEEIIMTSDGSGEAESYLPFLEQLYCQYKPNLILFAANSLGNELAARLSCRVKGSCALDITGMEKTRKGLTVKRRIMGLQAEGRFLFEKPPYLATISQGAFPKAEENGTPKYMAVSWQLGKPDWYEHKIEEPHGKQQIEDCNLILVGGRGLGSQKAVHKLYELSQALKAGMGGTRPAVLNGWLPLRDMIGLSGNKVSPDMCVVFGASGCMPFLGGINKKAVIVAINNDPNALIFKYSDVGVVADGNAVIEALQGIQEKEREYGR